GHGSQIVMSQATRQALNGAGAGEVIVQPLGAVALKDFDQPVDLFQVCDADLPSVFPPLRLPTSDRHAPVAVLPRPLDADRSPLVGRRADLDWLDVLWQRAIGGDRVVAALVGPRGSGKSRLIAEFARRVYVRDARVVHHAGTEGWVEAFQRASTMGNGAGSDAP